MMKRMILLAWTASLCLGAMAGERPVRDPIGYCWKPIQMKRLVDYLESSCHLDMAVPGMVAGICPHDDYLYAGPVYLPLMRRIRAKEVVMFGVTHHDVRMAMNDPKQVIILDSYETWHGPYGPVGISPLRSEIRQHMPSDMVLISNEAHRLEHSIEGMVPFLQYYNRKVTITPIMVTGMNWERMNAVADRLAETIADYMKKRNLVPGRDIFFLISSDANHYGEDFQNTVFGTGEMGHDAAVENDWHIATDFLSGPVTAEKIKEEMAATAAGKALWCGRYSVPFGLLTTWNVMKRIAPHQVLTGTLLRYSDTYSAGTIPLRKTGFGITAPFSLQHWVGHLSMAYQLVPGQTTSSPKSGQAHE